MVTEFSLLAKLQRVLQSDLQETSLHGEYQFPLSHQILYTVDF